MDAVVVSDVASRTLRDRWVFKSLRSSRAQGRGQRLEVLLVVGHDPVPGPDVERVYELDRSPGATRRAARALGRGRGGPRAGRSLKAKPASGSPAWPTSSSAAMPPERRGSRSSARPLASEEPFGPLTRTFLSPTPQPG